MTPLLASAQPLSLNPPPAAAPVVQVSTPAVQPSAANESALPPVPNVVQAAAAAVEVQSRSPGEVATERRNAAFDALVPSVSPLSPDQIKDVIRRVLEEQAASQVPVEPPKSESVTLSTSFSSTTGPIRLLMANGYATALVIQDSTGAPWPILSATLGNDTAFSVTKPSNAPNVLILSPKLNFARTNLLLSLDKATVPVAIALEAGIDTAYYRATVIINQPGPGATLQSEAPLPAVDDPLLRSLLDGVPPVGSRRVAVRGAPDDTVGYFVGGRFFLRTGLIVRSPASIAALKSPVMSIYELPVTSRIEAMSRTGKALALFPDERLLVDQALGGESNDPRQANVPHGLALYPIIEAPSSP